MMQQTQNVKILHSGGKGHSFNTKQSPMPGTTVGPRDRVVNKTKQKSLPTQNFPVGGEETHKQNK